MAILHGSWILSEQDSYLFIWGETWRSPQVNFSFEEIALNPLALSASELSEWLQSQHQAIAQILPQQLAKKTSKAASSPTTNLPIHSQIIVLPTEISQPRKKETIFISPVHSAALESDADSEVYLQPWRVEGFCLPPSAAVKFLTSLPLNITSTENAFLGGDLRFWSQIARWSLDLISRSKFLPIIQRQPNNSVSAKWQVLLDSAVDGTRLEKFAAKMPLVCRTYQRLGNEELSPSPIYIDFPSQPQELILGFLNSAIDTQLREMVGNQPVVETRLMASLPSAVRQWLQGLSGASNSVDADAVGLERLEAALKAWTMPLQYQLASKNQFRTCFELRSPEPGETEWTLAYFLQAADNPEFLVDAGTIWQHPVEQLIYQQRSIQEPQETFLRGLGLASRLYPVIAPTLDTESPQFCHLNPMQAYEFIKAVAWRFEDSGLGVILPPSLANREGWANRLGLKISAETPKKKPGRLGLQSLLNFQWHLAIGGQTISKGEFDRLVALKSPLVEINGEWVELRPQDIKTAEAFFAARKDQMALSLEDALRLSSGDTQVIEKLPVVSFEASGALQELIGALTNNQAVAPLPTPKNFQGKLRPYQERGAAWLAFLERWGLGACLADDMGLGKTIQFIAFLLHLKEQDVLEKPTLLVCPTSVLGNWEREVKKFAPTLKVLQYHGDKRPKGKAFPEAVKNHDLVITSYSLIHRDIKSLQGLSWQIIVLDEAQNVKNAEAKQSQAVRQLDTTFRIALTGTPVENRLQELWSILDFLNPGYLGNKQFFQRRFAMPIEKYGDAASLNQLRALVQPFILRRLKTDRDIIQDLPDKQEMTVFCGLTGEQAALYQKVVETSLAEIESAEGLQRRGMILALLIKLKQICNHPAQYLKTNTLEQYSSGKLQRLEEMLEEVLAESNTYGVAGAGRALIFTQFAEWGKLLKPHLEKQLGREVFFLYGSTSKKQREEMIDRFQHDPQGPPIMILSLKAGGVGLNLTRANHVFHFDRWWNPAVENQATDRVFRIGQTRNVQVHKFVCNGTLEEKIHDMIESKKQLAEQVVGAGEEWLTELDTDQLRNLLILDRSAVIDEEAE
ncbi:SNF2-related helicase [Trichormus variabilis ATCC 29413]|uniref:SNF2-related helicase n=2 Tax=Anabaena variabilis TaxID=264691 RepID=Q3M801_TRIV2|nr:MULTISPECIES: DEAD/DEAH box helicase [Nostocaceae]ABA22885.1 SNF2-related helicase [Trichormus variabilis ATCC 29413]MBC1212909.1 DEAD/DEAH box helicase [Trichormus variabilis ARAD]MBC1256769.1 DEAD/DEAH box helicase [Trichormus variabilis V5]MBC1268113.1 DEAD/DEAH box helicase [Trichormus variabilis FSR]MBC1303429.1 DEAD/DEAH box helicase [Trichormus variabilis N2B]